MKKAIFLDRDGVINEVMSERVQFVNKKEEFFLLDGVAEAIALFNHKGYDVFVVTNQGGVGLGFMKEQTLDEVHAHMMELLVREDKDAIIQEVKSCVHKPRAGCTCRKPLPGMILSLVAKHNIDITASFMIGDMETDIESGQAAGVKTVLITKEEAVETNANHIYSSLYDFAINL